MSSHSSCRYAWDCLRSAEIGNDQHRIEKKHRGNPRNRSNHTFMANVSANLKYKLPTT